MAEEHGASAVQAADLDQHLRLRLPDDLLVDPAVEGVLERAHAHPVDLVEDDVVLVVQHPLRQAHGVCPGVLGLPDLGGGAPAGVRRWPGRSRPVLLLRHGSIRAPAAAIRAESIVVPRTRRFPGMSWMLGRTSGRWRPRRFALASLHLALPALVILAGVWLGRCRTPISSWVDPDYPYLLNALSIAEGAPPTHTH